MPPRPVQRAVQPRLDQLAAERGVEVPQLRVPPHRRGPVAEEQRAAAEAPAPRSTAASPRRRRRSRAPRCRAGGPPGADTIRLATTEARAPVSRITATCGTLRAPVAGLLELDEERLGDLEDLRHPEERAVRQVLVVPGDQPVVRPLEARPSGSSPRAPRARCGTPGGVEVHALGSRAPAGSADLGAACPPRKRMTPASPSGTPAAAGPACRPAPGRLRQTVGRQVQRRSRPCAATPRPAAWASSSSRSAPRAASQRGQPRGLGRARRRQRLAGVFVSAHSSRLTPPSLPSPAR